MRTILLIALVLLTGCAHDLKTELREGDTLSVTGHSDHRYQVEWVRQEVRSTDGLPRDEFRRRIWINEETLASLGIAAMPERTEYRMIGGKFERVIHLDSTNIVPAVQQGVETNSR